MLRIVNEKTESSFSLNRKESINLELCLNVTKYGILWKELGDILYEYGVGPDERNIDYRVTHDQYVFLEMLRTKESWHECSRL